MMTDRFILTTKVGERARKIVWDPTRPVGIGFPFRWILERTDSGIRVRYLGELTDDLMDNVQVNISEEQILRGEQIQLPEKAGLNGPGIKVCVQPLRKIKPPYLSSRVSKEVGSKPLQLFAYSGIQRSMVDCEGVHSAFVGEFRGKPVFVAYKNADGLQIKPLLSGVFIKLKGSPAIPAYPNETLQLTAQKISNATIVRGNYWWKFNFVQLPDPVSELPEDSRSDKEAFWFLGLLGALGCLTMVFLGVMAYLGPTKTEAVPEKLNMTPPVVTFKSKVPKLVHEFKESGSSGSAMPQPKADADQKTEKTASKAASKHEQVEVKASVAKVAKPLQRKHIAAAVPKKAEVSKKMAQAPVMPRKIEPKPVTEAPKAKPVKTVVHEAPRSNPNALKEANVLREALLGAKALAQKTTILEKSKEGKALASGENLATASLGDLSPAEIKPKYSGSGKGITSLGGGAAGNTADSGAGKGAGIGYGSGTHAGLSGQGSSLISVEGNGYHVAEGLTKEEVGAVIHSHMSEIRYCHEAALLANPMTEGKLVLNFTINPAGIVSAVSTASSTVPEASLPPCVIRRLKSWLFPHPKGGVSVTVSYPFLFRRLDVQ